MTISTVCIGVWRLFWSHEKSACQVSPVVFIATVAFGYFLCLVLLYCSSHIIATVMLHLSSEYCVFVQLIFCHFKIGYKRYQAEKRYKLIAKYKYLWIMWINSCANHAYLLYEDCLLFDLILVLSLLLSYI